MIISNLAENEDSIQNTKNLTDFFFLIIFVIFFFIFKYFSQKKIKSSKSENNKIEIEDPFQNKLSYHIKSNMDKSLDAFKILKKLEEDKIVGDLGIYHDLLEMSIRLKHYENIHNLYEIIADEYSSFVRLETKSYLIIIKGILSEIKENEMNHNKNFKELIKKYKEDLINRELKINLEIYGLMIETLIELKDFNESWNYIIEMKEKKVIPCTEIYDKILKGISKNKSKDNIKILIEIYKTFMIEGIEKINLETLNNLIEVLINYKLIEKAEILLHEMKRHQILICVKTYSLFFKAYEETNEVEKAIKFYYEIKIKLNENVYNNLINLTLKCKRIDLMNDLYSKMRTDKITITEEIYLNLIKGNFIYKNYLKTFEIFDSISPKILDNYHIEIHNIVMEAFIDCGLFKKVFPIYESLKRKSEENPTSPKPNLKTHILILKVLTHLGRIEEAKQLYTKIKFSIKSDENIFNKITEAFAQTNNLDLVLWIINEMKLLGISKTINSYSILMKIYSVQINEEKCVMTFDEMLRENLKPNSSIYSHLMEMFIKKKKIIQAIGIYTDMKLNKCQIDEIYYDKIIQACIYHHKFDKSLQIINEAFQNKSKILFENFKYFFDTLLVNKFIKLNEKIKFIHNLTKLMKENNVNITSEIHEKINKLNNMHIQNQLD